MITLIVFDLQTFFYCFEDVTLNLNLHAGFSTAVNSKSREEHVQNRSETWSMYTLHIANDTHTHTHTTCQETQPTQPHRRLSWRTHTIWGNFSCYSSITGSGQFCSETSCKVRLTAVTVNPVIFLSEASVSSGHLFDYCSLTIVVNQCETGAEGQHMV